MGRNPASSAKCAEHNHKKGKVHSPLVQLSSSLWVVSQSYLLRHAGERWDLQLSTSKGVSEKGEGSWYLRYVLGPLPGPRAVNVYCCSRVETVDY